MDTNAVGIVSEMWKPQYESNQTKNKQKTVKLNTIVRKYVRVKIWPKFECLGTSDRSDKINVQLQ